jgi:ribonuclease P protein component
MNPLSKQAPRQPVQETADVSSQLQRQSLAGVRLRRHSDYQRAYAAARKRQSASMSWFFAPQSPDFEQPGPRVGLTVGKVLGKAHDRNRIKRRMREALRRHVDLLPEGFDLIFHPRRTVLTLEFAKLEAEIVRVLEQARAEIARSIVTSTATPDKRVEPTS